MKAPAFAYTKARTLEQVFDLLEKHGDGARLLAGGQSLLATLNLRLSSPEILIDITGIRDLAGITVEHDKVVIGALTTHAELERSAEIANNLPLLAQAAPHIAHVAIRNAGTIGGSIAMADPAAEWPACCLALDADFVIANKDGQRKVKARDFFQALYTTAIEPARSSDRDRDWDSCKRIAQRIRRTHAAPRRLRHRGSRRNGTKNDGALTNVQLAYLGAGHTPVLAKTAMAKLENKSLSDSVVAEAAVALASDLEPGDDTYSTAATKLHLARVITKRALAALNH